MGAAKRGGVLENEQGQTGGGGGRGQNSGVLSKRTFWMPHFLSKIATWKVQNFWEQW